MNGEPVDGETLETRRARLLEVVRERALTRFDEPRELASGELSRDFIDAKRGLSRGEDLRLACGVIADAVAAAGIAFDAVGGLTLGADQFSHGVAAFLGDDHEWFVVLKEAKGRGTDQLVEGAVLSPGTRVLLVDDVVTTGGSIQKAYRHVTDTGADVVAAVTLVDRSDIASDFFDSEGVVYLPLFTYRDLGIDPIKGA
jgi:orotate phosphoribosyltransferase